MSIRLIDSLETLGNFPVAHTKDIQSGEKRLDVVLGEKQNVESGKGLSTNDYTTSDKEKLAGIASGATKVVVDASLSSTSTNAIQNKAVNAALSGKVDVVSGKGLSTNDYTTPEKTKLAGVDEGANKTVTDASLSSTSINPIQNKAVYAGLSGKASQTSVDAIAARVSANETNIATLTKFVSTNFVTPQMYGAVGDGTTDCSDAFSSAITYANTNGCDIHIPQGKYLITSDLPEVYGNIMIFGEGYQRIDGITSIVLDKRTSDNPLFKFKQGTAGTKQGGGIYSLSISGCSIAKNCIEIASHSFGWDGNFHYVSIANYTHSAIKTDANDIWWSNMLIHNCGNNTDRKYAIEMISSSNAQRYSDVHIEHCRYAIHVGGNAFLNSFENCKVEASDVHITDVGDSSNPVILIDANSVVDFPPVKFSNCYFIGMDAQHYVDLQQTKSYDTSAFFMKSTTSQPVSISACNFFGGQGTGTKKYNSQYKYLNLSNGIVNSCIFQRVSYLAPGIVMYNGVFSSNRVNFANNLITGHDASLATKHYAIQFPDRYIETPAISLDGWFVDGFYPCNRNIDCDSNARSTNHWYYRGRPIQKNNDKFITYVVKNLSANNNILGYLEISIQSYNTARINGKIAVKINHYEPDNYNYIDISNISAASEIQNANVVTAYLKDGDLFIQITGDPNGYFVDAHGLEMYECFGYVDTYIDAAITDYDRKAELVIPKSLPTFLPETKNKIDNTFTNANIVKYDGTSTTTSDGLTYTYNTDGTIAVTGTTNWDTTIKFFTLNKTGTYTIFMEKISGTFPYTVNVKVDDSNKGLLASGTTSAQSQYTGNIKEISMWIGKGTTVNATVKLAVAAGKVDFTNDYVSYTGDTGLINHDVAQLKSEILNLISRVSALETTD